MPSHFSEILSFSSPAFCLIVSQFLYSETPAVTIPPIASTAMPAGDVSAPSAPDKIPPEAAAPSAAAPAAAAPPDNPDKAPITFPPVVIIEPIPLVNFPTAATAGPTAAAIAANFKIMSCCSGDRDSNLSSSFPAASPSFSKAGERSCIARSARPAPASFSLFIVVCRESIGSTVSAKVCCVVPSASSSGAF